MQITKTLFGCVANSKLEEIDGKEFEIETLQELINLLKTHKHIHLNYFENEEDIDIWITKEE